MSRGRRVGAVPRWMTCSGVSTDAIEFGNEALQHCGSGEVGSSSLDTLEGELAEGLAHAARGQQSSFPTETALRLGLDLLDAVGRVEQHGWTLPRQKQGEKLPLGIHLALSTEGEAAQALVLEVGKDAFDGAHARSVELSPQRRIKLEAHALCGPTALRGGRGLGAFAALEDRHLPLWGGSLGCEDTSRADHKLGTRSLAP